MEGLNISVDISGALDKNAVIRAMPKAVRYQMTKWGGETLKHIKRGIMGVRLHTGTGHLQRNVGLFVGDGILELGTHVGGTGEVVYGRILNEGGKIMAKKAKYLTIPFPGVKGYVRNFPDTFVIKSKAGNLVIVQKDKYGRLKPLFLLRKEVTIPAFHWLTASVEDRRRDLDNAMSEQAVFDAAVRMKGGGGELPGRGE